LYQKTFKGYSLVETLISLFLLSLLVIVYSNLSAQHHMQTTRDILINKLFNDAHTIAGIIEDKSIEQIPVNLFSSNNPVSITILESSNRTAEMSLPIFANLFAIQIPNDILISNSTVICSISTVLFGEIEFNQFYVYLMKHNNKKIVYGYASFIF
jgi:hypothetical protein